MPEAEKQALLYGSWDSFSGQVFTEWRNDPNHYEDQRWTHVIAPFTIPKHWKIYRGYDFGFSTIRMEERYMEEQKKCCCHHGGEISDVEARVRTRTDEEYKKLLNRLNRIEGQIRGVKSMLENDAYCTDIVLQVSAINAALNSFNRQLLAEHIRTCVADDIRNGKDDTIEDLVNTVTRLMK